MSVTPVFVGGGSATRITDADAATLAGWIKRREVSCREVMTAYLAQIDRCNPAVNAIVSRPDPAQLLTQADGRDALLATGRYLGPLHGFPQAPKDLAAVSDMPTSMGSPLFAGNIPAADCVFIERVRAGGAIFVGRTNTPEFGVGGQTYNTVFGITRNAWDTTKTSAGSSGGAAVALATRMLPVADGSDMMGSLRTPAAYNNVFGFRSSRGLIPMGPGPELYYNQFSYEGPMARNVPDLALLLGIMAGHDPRVPLSLHSDPARFSQPLDRDFKGTRIGWLGDIGAQLAIEPGVLEVCERAIESFRTLGCTVETLGAKEFGFPLETLWQSWTTLRSFLIAGDRGAHYHDAGKRSLMKPELIWEIERGLVMPATDVYDASVQRSAWHRRLHELFAQYDYLVLPGSQLFPYAAELTWPRDIAGQTMDTYHRWMEVVIPASLAGAPVMSAPAGFNDAGLPMGIQIIGPVNADFDVLQLSHAYDLARGRADRSKPATAG